MKRASLFTLFAGALTVSNAQPPAFEVAAIKLNNSGRTGGGISTYPARIKVINSSLKFCVEVAWNVKDFQVSGATGWMDAEHYDIDAVAASPFTMEQARTMLQTLLAGRFGLTVHRETRDRPGYALVTGKNGPKLPPPKDSQNILFSRTPSGDRTLDAQNISMSQLASALSNALGAIVVDQTGLDGKFDASFQWTPDSSLEPRTLNSRETAPPPPPDAASGPSIFTALQEKLGLKLESRKVPTTIIVIDSASRPTEN